MSIDIIDGIVFVSFVGIVLAVIERRRAIVGLVKTANTALGKWSRLLENIAKCVVVVFGIIFIIAIVLRLYWRCYCMSLNLAKKACRTRRCTWKNSKVSGPNGTVGEFPY